MKKVFIFFLSFWLLAEVARAQVTTFGDSKPEEFEFLPYAGSRIIQGNRVDMGGKKYCLVFSKSAKGLTPDTVYVQQYIKKDLEWETILSASRISPNTIFIWGRRGGFFTDDRKNGIAYFAFSEENLKLNEKIIVGYFITYLGELFSIEESRDGRIKKSENYSKLPVLARENIEAAFEKLDKWKD